MTLKHWADTFNATYCDKYGAKHTIIKKVYSDIFICGAGGKRIEVETYDRRLRAQKTLEREGYTDVRWTGCALEYVTYSDNLD